MFSLALFSPKPSLFRLHLQMMFFVVHGTARYQFSLQHLKLSIHYWLDSIDRLKMQLSLMVRIFSSSVRLAYYRKKKAYIKKSSNMIATTEGLQSEWIRHNPGRKCLVRVIPRSGKMESKSLSGTRVARVKICDLLMR